MKVKALSSVQIRVIAKDSGWDLISTGGETITIELHNEWIVNTVLDWIEVSGAKQIFVTPVVATMTDLGNGTYIYDYTMLIDGKITILVYTVDIGADSYFYDNYLLTEPYHTYNKSTTINYDWDIGAVVNGVGDFVSAKFEFSLKAPTTEAYTIWVHSDDGARIWINGVTVYDQWAVNPAKESFSVNLMYGVYYSWIINWRESQGSAKLVLTWQTPTISETLIPSTAYTM